MSEAMGGRPNLVLSILVVDDDSTCLSVIAGCLQKNNHHVIATKNPMDALSTLRMKWQSFDLILTAVHMPEMSGLDLLNHALEEEFKIPLILMSAVVDETIMRQGLNNGASFYFVKPVILEILDRVWQFVLPKNLNKGPISSFGMLGSENERQHSPSNNMSHNIVNNNNNNNFPSFFNIYDAQDVRLSRNHMLNQANNNVNHFQMGNVAPIGNRKPKLVWTRSLHNQFLEAVNKIGLDRAVPKKILEYMNVPGLKRENVASHLQKYRIFLKRISTQGGIHNSWNDRPLRSSFVLNEISFLTNNLQREYQLLLGKSQKTEQTSSEQVISPGEDPHQRGVISYPSDTGTQFGTLEPSNLVFNTANVSSVVLEHHQEEAISTAVNQEMKNLSYVPSNYVGLRLTSNGELVGTLKDMPIIIEDNATFTNVNNGINNGANQAANSTPMETVGNLTFSSYPDEPSNHMFMVDNQSDEYIPSFMDNVTEQGTDFGVTQELFNSNHVDQETFGSDLSFESYNMQGNATENAQGFDTRVFINDDFSMDDYFMQEDGQNFEDFFQDCDDGGFDF